MSDESLPPILVRAIEALSPGGTTIGGFVIGGPVGAVVGAAGGPTVAGLIVEAAGRIRHRWTANAVEAVSYAASAAELEPSQVLDRLLTAPNRQELLVNALQGAAHATLQAKIRALGESLRKGAVAGEESEVDHELLFVRAMADFEEAHIRVLNHLAERANFASGGSSPLETIAELPGIGAAARPVVATLERHGAIEPVPLDVERLFGDFYDNMPSVRTAPLPGMPRLRQGGPVPATPPQTWRITGFGEECLERLRTAGEEP